VKGFRSHGRPPPDAMLLCCPEPGEKHPGMELEPVLNGVHPLGDGVALVIPGLRVSPRARISGVDSQVRQQGAQRGSTAICEF
jgi:hypothetical protein